MKSGENLCRFFGRDSRETIHFRKTNAIVYGRFNLLRRKILKCNIDKSKIGWYPRRHSREICRKQNNPKRTMKSNEGALRPRMAAALLLVLFRRIWGWDHNPKQLNNQQRGSHRRLGNAHGARDDPEATSFRRARNATWQPWQAASCRPICLDTQCPACTQDRLPWLGLKAVETPSASCESCHALSALFPIAGARAANTAKKKTIATIVATTKDKKSDFKFA